MGRQWLHAKREVANLKKGRVVGKLTNEISAAAKTGGGDPDLNPRLAAALEKARKASVTKDAIERAIRKGTGEGEKMTLEHLVFEGYAPNKVPVIVEALTDNPNRTTPQIRVLFRDGQLGATGSNRFLFDQVGIVEAHRENPEADLEAVAIEAGADDVTPLSHQENDDIPPGRFGARFLTPRTATAAVSKWLLQNGWSVTTCELGYSAKSHVTLADDQLAETAAFLQQLEDHDDVHRVWAAI